jgi:hypothetical protein
MHNRQPQPTPSPTDFDKSNFILTKDRHLPLRRSGRHSHLDSDAGQHIDVGQRTDQYIIPHANCPKFNAKTLLSGSVDANLI